MWNGEWHMGWMWIWWLVGIVVLILVVRLATSSAGGRASSAESAEEILKRRYAQGEIDQEEYERKLQDLRR